MLERKEKKRKEKKLSLFGPAHCWPNLLLVVMSKTQAHFKPFVGSFLLIHSWPIFGFVVLLNSFSTTFTSPLTNLASVL
jgi:hypothetical protein